VPSARRSSTSRVVRSILKVAAEGCLDVGSRAATAFIALSNVLVVQMDLESAAKGSARQCRTWLRDALLWTRRRVTAW
jgi:hypothetical protein